MKATNSITSDFISGLKLFYIHVCMYAINTSTLRQRFGVHERLQYLRISTRFRVNHSPLPLCFDQPSRVARAFSFSPRALAIPLCFVALRLSNWPLSGRSLSGDLVFLLENPCKRLRKHRQSTFSSPDSPGLMSWQHIAVNAFTGEP